MPGSGWTLCCPRCASRHELTTGADQCWRCGTTWGYEQRVCTACRTLRSVALPPHCDSAAPPGCSACGGPLTEWTGRVWFDDRPDGFTGEERVAGPCPGCGLPLDVRDHGSETLLWD